MDEEVDFLTDLRESGSLFRFGRSVFPKSREYGSKVSRQCSKLYCLIALRLFRTVSEPQIEKLILLSSREFLVPYSDFERLLFRNLEITEVK